MSKRAHFARQMQQGAYHRHIFTQESRVSEVLIVRNGAAVGSGSARANLTTSLGSALDAALKR